MAKKNPVSETAKRIQRTEAYAEKVRKMFAQTVNDILALNKSIPKLEEGVMFSFDDTSEKMQKEVEDALKRLHSSALLAIEQGITLEWEQANAECDELVSSIYGEKALSDPKLSAVMQRNTSAMKAFIERTENGLNLSDRVWLPVRQLRDEMEVAMTVAIGSGKSAASISRTVRECLNDPDLMFRRFRYKDENGKWRKKWKKRIKDEETGKYKWIDYDRDSYKTGTGVYKSSAKNAMRVARTETNIAYRRADNARWQQMDFVLGQKIQLSKNHPVRDICDTLQGVYPVDFVFDGWHPQCFCFVTPVLVDDDEMVKMNEAFINGEDYTPSGDTVKDYPDNFKDWVKDNADKISAAKQSGKMPYFVQNNQLAIDNILNPKKQLTAKEKAQIRHDSRTPEQIEAIRLKWKERQERIEAERLATEAKRVKKTTTKSITPIEKVTVPDIEYVADSKKMTNDERVHAACRNVSQYFGEKSTEATIVNYYKDKTGISDVQCKSYLKFINEHAGKYNTPEFPVINHLIELKKSTSLDKIYEPWRERYNEVIRKLNAYDFTDGYQAIVSDIEEAYNIYRLSISKEALKFGLENLSARTPYVLLDEFTKKIPGYIDYIPDKDFFDSLPKFVPLFTKKPVGVSCGAYHLPSRGHVVIGLNDADNIERLTNSIWHRKGLIYHEFGHALDSLTGQRSDSALISIYDDFCKQIRKDPDMLNKMKQAVVDTLAADKKAFEEWWPTSNVYLDFEKRINEAKRWADKNKLFNERKKARYAEYSKRMCELEEQVGSFTDSLQAAMPSHEFLAPRGHSVSYFASKDKQLAEFIAHCSENYWSGNPYFEKIAPDLYRQMREYIESKLPDAIRKMRSK